MAIEKFEGDYRFLSNFHPCEIILDGDKYASVEHAYQAAKTIDFEERARLQSWNLLNATEAKRAGRKVTLRSDWGEVKNAIMLDLLRQKFSDDLLETMLLDTQNEDLVEGNWWGDTYWGMCNGKGENHLGKLLMKVREELKNKA